ncbi:hypothetical protein V3C99_016885 [Haemonchus contortus]|uniref:HisKA domain-containing protein n=1 Tax=Haemonchus contortus TaxID=6289 RepID=A0A7I5E976_HAECO
MPFDLEHEIQLTEMERQAGFDALVQTVNIMAGRVDAIFNRVAQMQDDIHILIARTTPTSNCVFCASGENIDTIQLDAIATPMPFVLLYRLYRLLRLDSFLLHLPLGL